MSVYKGFNAKYTDKCVTVYQAFNHLIANEILEGGTFGPSFKLDRMTWIKPSFLWMMYRCGWGNKSDQERIFSINISKEGFDYILSKAVLTKYKPKIHGSSVKWKEMLNESDIIFQFDPDRDVYGNKLDRKAIQLGLRGDAVEKYINEWIVDINDITNTVHDWKLLINTGQFNSELLPLEKEYNITVR
ncbi:DUF4291 domain-containing protein [Paenibacillus sp. BJ-4]|uniref:DUF4291 domain-containing protein n=1 Tax=Paenibacillus sp. BJ-4 TaxID=2878097 RepID=UPI001CF085C4|nr:DUF4291 domain-containing protein [Paenibacillus sp. BJ-4]